MDGWMYRFKGGPLDGITGGPIDKEPPKTIYGMMHDGQPVFAEVTALSTSDAKLIGASLYQRTNMSKLGDDVPRSLVRGAEYAVEEEK
jgi:hypothetical protein